MNKYVVGSKEYELARKAFAFLCNQIRVKQKTDYENIDYGKL